MLLFDVLVLDVEVLEELEESDDELAPELSPEADDEDDSLARLEEEPLRESLR